MAWQVSKLWLSFVLAVLLVVGLAGSAWEMDMPTSGGEQSGTGNSTSVSQSSSNQSSTVSQSTSNTQMGGAECGGSSCNQSNAQSNPVNSTGNAFKGPGGADLYKRLVKAIHDCSEITQRLNAANARLKEVEQELAQDPILHPEYYRGGTDPNFHGGGRDIGAYEQHMQNLEPLRQERDRLSKQTIPQLLGESHACEERSGYNAIMQQLHAIGQ